jgi:hypothetical protein
MEKTGMQFVGINPANKTLAHPDGLLEGKTTELKNVKSGSNVDRQLSACVKAAIQKKAQQLIVVIEDAQNSNWIKKRVFDRVNQLKKHGPLELTKTIIITPNEKSIILI